MAVSGSFSGCRTGAELSLTVSSGAVLECERFNLVPGEVTIIHQPSADSVLWIRIVEERPSEIRGTLKADGVVVLLNPNGFYFGPNASVSAGGFAATTTSSSPVSPAAGALWPDAGAPATGSILNYGAIRATALPEHGGTIQLLAADQLHLGATSVIEARGNPQGISRGGCVALKSAGSFSDDAGSWIDVSGGPQGGDGGVVELCAPSLARIHSQIEAAALPGWQGGQLWLDPYDIILSEADNADPTPAPVVYSSDAPGQSLRLNVNAAFYGFSQITLQATHDILFEPGTTWNLNDSTGIGDLGSLLRLEASNNIVFGDNSRLIAGTGWSAHLAAGVDFSSPSLAVRPGIGGIYLNGLTGGSGALQSADGDIQLRAGLEVLVDSGYVRSVGGGNISITTLDGDVDAGTKNEGYQFGRTGPVISPTGLGGIGTTAGGSVSIAAGRDVLSHQAPIGAFGAVSGNVNVSASRDIQGQFMLRNGLGTLRAGRDVGTGGSAVSLGLSQGGWQVAAGWDAANGKVVAGVGDLYLNEIYNPNGSLNPNRLLSGARRAFQFDYALDAFADLSAGNSVHLLGDNVAHVQANADRPLIYPPRLGITAGPGGVLLGNDLILYPSPLGSLSLNTTGGGSLRSRQGSYAQLILSDSDSPDYETFATAHAATPLHLNSGDAGITLGISGNLENIFLRSPRSANIIVQGSAVNVSLEVQNLSVSDASQLRIDGDYSTGLTAATVTLADAPNLAIFTDPLVAVNTRLGPLLSYDALTHQLQFQGRMTQQDLYDLLNPQVYLLDPVTHTRQYDGSGMPLIGPAQFTTDTAALNALYAASQAVPVSPLARNGLLVGGPGRFAFSARNLDLGASAGIRSVAVLLNPSLAAISLYGADLSVLLSGDLQMAWSQIASFGGGSIEVMAAGRMDVGAPPQSIGGDIPRGIYTAHGGHVRAEAGGDITVSGSRIANYDGGDVTVISDQGSVDAGVGGTGSFWVTTRQLDPATGQLVLRTENFSGSGIMALTRPNSASPVGNISVYAGLDLLAGCGGILQLPGNGPCSPETRLELSVGRYCQADVRGCYNVFLQNSGPIEGGSCPMIFSQPLEQIVTAGDNATLTVTASGAPALNYQWWKEGAPLPGATASSLTLFNVNRADAGSYSVTVSNSFGAVISRDAGVHVRVPQRFLTPEVLPGGMVRLWFRDRDGGTITPADLTSFTVEASTNLIDWTPLPNLPLLNPSGLLYADDLISGDSPMRFYRVSSR